MPRDRNEETGLTEGCQGSWALKYFTRQRYQANQKGSVVAAQAWDVAGAEYAAHLRSIEGLLTESIRPICATKFHDAEVTGVDQSSSGSVRIVLDATSNPWGPRGIIQISFSGVAAFAQSGQVLGDTWLYHEVHLARCGFELHVLLETSEFVIEAMSVVWETAVEHSRTQ